MNCSPSACTCVYTHLQALVLPIVHPRLCLYTHTCKHLCYLSYTHDCACTHTCRHLCYLSYTHDSACNHTIPTPCHSGPRWHVTAALTISSGREALWSSLRGTVSETRHRMPRESPANHTTASTTLCSDTLVSITHLLYATAHSRRGGVRCFSLPQWASGPAHPVDPGIVSFTTHCSVPAQLCPAWLIVLRRSWQGRQPLHSQLHAPPWSSATAGELQAAFSHPRGATHKPALPHVLCLPSCARQATHHSWQATSGLHLSTGPQPCSLQVGRAEGCSCAMPGEGLSSNP